MIILTLTNCPPALRGDLTKWLVEIHTGVYVGRVSARVRDNLWDRVKEHSKTGKATLVYPAKNEQRMVFCVHNTTWEPIDFDGLTLMLQPSVKRLSEKTPLQTGFSKAYRFQQSKKMSRKKTVAKPLGEYVVIDIETTGLDSGKDEIIEIAAILVKDREVIREFNKMINIDSNIPSEVIKLTGISKSILKEKGSPLVDVISEFREFIGDYTLISHNLAFDVRFLREAIEETGVLDITNQGIDTLSLARKRIRGLKSYRLEALMKHFKLSYENPHRSLEDARATMALYHKLIEIRDSKKSK